MMKRYTLLFLLWMLLLAACSPAGGAEPAVGDVEAPVATTAVPTQPTERPDEAKTETEPAATAECPEPTSEQKLLQNRAYGYCLLYPATYQVVQNTETSVDIVLDSQLNVTDPRLGLRVEPANGRTAVQIAEEAEYPADFGIEHSTLSIAGVEAEMLDKVPGQDLSRRVLFVHEDRLYDMFFSPVSAGEAMKQFYTGIIDSFQLVPVVADVPLQAGPECPVETADSQQYRNEKDGYCLLLPADFTIDKPGAGEAVAYVDSIMNVENPKLFINVAPADGRPIYEQVDELAASFEGFELERTFGLLVDGEPAERIDNVPGQDISRQVIFMHNGQLFTLTFVPSDPTAGAVYEEMEALYELVMASFSFLQSQ